MRNVYYLSDKCKTRSNPEVLSFDDLPLWIQDDLCELRSAWGIPSDVFVREMAEDFLTAHWDLKHNRPRKTRWQIEDKKKPRLQSRRSKKNKLNGGTLYE